MEEKTPIMLEEALKYLSKSWAVIPIGAGEDKKSPLIPTWAEFQKRLPTVQEVTAWWTQWPEANIAVVTGKISGISVVDVDCKKDPNNPDIIIEQGSTKGLPPTLTAKTGSGGWHLFYQYPEGLASRIGVKPLVDIKSDGGYIILAPSLHKSGRRYEWVLIEELQPFPLENFDLFDHKYKNTDWSSLIEGVPVGERNKAAAQLVGKLLKSFKQPDWGATVWPMVVYWNKGLSEPLHETELRAVFNSITNRELKALSGIQPEEEGEDIVLPMSEVVARLKNDVSLNFPCGFELIDEALSGGFKEGDLIVVTGKSGFGKTTLAQTFSFNMAMNKIPSLWLSYEVLLRELWAKFTKMGADDTLMTYTPIRNVSGKVEWVEKKIIEAKEKYKTKVVFIDHLGFLVPTTDNKSVMANYSLYLGAICRELKRIAIKEEVIIVLMVHLRKANGDNLTMDDIGHSAAISQESDAVLLINRQLSGVKDGEDIYKEDSQIKILKNRRTGISKEISVRMNNGLLLESTKAQILLDRSVDFANKKVEVANRGLTEAKSWEHLSDDEEVAAKLKVVKEEEAVRDELLQKRANLALEVASEVKQIMVDKGIAYIHEELKSDEINADDINF